MTRLAIAYVASLAAFCVLDFLWLGVSVVDLLWGAVVTGLAASAGFALAGLAGGRP